MKNKIQNYSCPVCDEGQLVAYDNGVFNLLYNRKNYSVNGMLYSQCDNCGIKTYLPDQLDANKLKVEAFQLELAEYISPSQILMLREKYELTQSQASEIFGGGVNAFSKWERGEVVPSTAAAKLMKLAMDNVDFMQNLVNLTGIKLDCGIKKNRRAGDSDKQHEMLVHVITHNDVVHDVYDIFNAYYTPRIPKHTSRVSRRQQVREKPAPEYEIYVESQFNEAITWQ